MDVQARRDGASWQLCPADDSSQIRNHDRLRWTTKPRMKTIKSHIPQDSRDSGRAGRAAKMTSDASSTCTNPLKRRRSSAAMGAPNKQPKHRHHHLSHVQSMPAATEPAPQDPVFAQSQLLRSICAALTIAGYDSVRPSALESFRAQVEEYMLAFLSDVKTSMHSARRVSPLPTDFTFALSSLGLSSGDLEPHLSLPYPTQLAAPTVAPPAPAEAPPPNLAPMLGPELQTPAVSVNEVKENSYIPPHFPALPSRHAYMCTNTFTEREGNARKIREKATEEGILAEQALRKLMAAKIKKEVVPGRTGERGSSREIKAKARESSWKDVVADLLLEDGQASTQDSGVAGMGSFGSSVFGTDGAGDEKEDKLEALMRTGGLSVNHDRGHWRRGAGAAVR